MASGLLGQSALVGATTTTVYTVPASKLGVLNINIVNRDTTNAASVRLALTTAAEPTDAEYIEYGAEIPAKGVLERTGIALEAAKNVVVYDAQGTCSVSVYGLEQSA